MRNRKQHRFPKMTLALALALACLLALFCGCESAPEDAYLLDRAKELIPMTAPVNALFYEEGIPVEEGATATLGYFPADAEALAAWGFSSVEEIRSYMRGIWTQDFCDRFSKTSILAPVVGDNGISTYAYCYDAHDREGNFTGVMVSEAGRPIKADPVNYDLDTLAVTWKSSETATLTLSATVKNAEGEEQDRTLKVTLARDTDGEWRLSSYTFAAYRKDSYEN